MSRAINHGPEPCTCAERAGASWSLPWTPSKLSQHGSVVRRGAVPSVTGLSFGVMAWLLAAACERTIQKERAQSAAVGQTSPE